MGNKGGGKPSDSRAGKRRDSNRKVGVRVPELGYYLIVTDTKETEKNFFEGLRDSIPPELKDRLVIKVEKAKTIELVEKALELAGKETQYRMPWIVFDRDQVKDFDEIIKVAKENGVGQGWSNPCFADKFEKITRQKYSKNDKDIYQKLKRHGNEEKAILLAEKSLQKCVEDGKRKPSEMCPASMVQRLVGEIQGKIGKYHDNVR